MLVQDEPLRAHVGRDALQTLGGEWLRLTWEATAIVSKFCPSVPSKGHPFNCCMISRPMAVKGTVFSTAPRLIDSSGLPPVNTHKTLRKLQKRGLHSIGSGRLHIGDVKALGRFAELYGDGHSEPRPLV